MRDPSEISLTELCGRLRLDPQIAQEFVEFGLFPAEAAGGQLFVKRESLGRVWQAASLHLALGINKEGIDVILELRAEVTGLQGVVDRLEREIQALNRALGQGTGDIGVTEVY